MKLSTTDINLDLGRVDDRLGSFLAESISFGLSSTRVEEVTSNERQPARYVDIRAALGLEELLFASSDWYSPMAAIALL